MPDIAIARELTPTKGRYIATIAGVPGEAELTFSRTSPTLVIADHTLTPVALRGQGIATVLVEHMVADARREGFKIRPTCPFVVALFDHRPEWSDLRA